MTDASGSADAGTPGGDGAPGNAGAGAGAGQQQVTDWTAALPEEDRGFVTTKGYKSPADLVRAYRGAERLIGKPVDSLIVAPGEQATDEDWAGVYNKLGRPKEPGDYKFDPVENVSEQTDNWIREHAHKLGLNQRQAAALRASIYQHGQAGMAAVKEAAETDLKATTQALQKEWGQAYDDYHDLAIDGMEYAAGSSEAAKALYQALVMSRQLTPAVANAFRKVGEALKEDGVVSGKVAGFAKTPAEAQQEIKALNLDSEFMRAYGDKGHPGYRAANEKMQALFAAAYPDAA